MIKIILGLALLVCGAFEAKAEVPKACASCMAQCPHITKDIKPCDNGCPGVCTPEQAEEISSSWKGAAAPNFELPENKCLTCMSRCPHITKDFRDCDRGCPEVCTPETMRAAFVSLNEKYMSLLKKCGSKGSKGDTDSEKKKGIGSAL